MKPSYVTALLVPPLSVSLSVMILLASALIYWDFRTDLQQTVSFTLKEDESTLLAVVNQPEFDMKDLYLSYSLKGLSFSLFDENQVQLHPKTLLDHDLSQLLQVSPGDKRFYILTKSGSRRYINMITRLEINNQKRTVISQKDLSSLYSGLVEDIVKGIVLLVAGGLILGFLLYRVSRKLISPLSSLIVSVDHISRGNYSERVALEGLREIDEVGAAFNRMAVKIEGEIDALQIENEKKELFISGFTHELKTPLTNIIGYSDHLILRDVSPEDRKNALHIINREGKRLNMLGVYLRDYILRDPSLIERESVSLAVISRDIRNLSRKMLSHNHMELDVNYTEGDVLINRELYLTCCLNILQNAINASKAGSTIEISLERVDHRFRSVFVDRGSGIPPDELSRITTPFYQGTSAWKPDDKDKPGFGLGLFIVNRIIREGFKGSLSIESTTGEGTIVEIILTAV